MSIREHKFHALDSRFSESTPVDPKKPFASAIQRLANSHPELEADFDKVGHVRHLTGFSASNQRPYIGDAIAQAANFLGQSEVSQALNLSNVNLENGIDETMPFGHRITFPQVIVLKDGTKVEVRGGNVHIAMDKAGKIFNVASTLKFGRRPVSLGKILSTDQAVANARTKFTNLTRRLTALDTGERKALREAIKTCKADVKLVLSEHAGKFDPVYEVRLSTDEPRYLMLFLVKAKTGEVVHHQSLLHFSVSNPKAQAALDRIPVKCFLQIPDPKGDIATQVKDHFIEALPDPKLLKNERFEMLVLENRKWVNVKAQPDGSYNFSPKGAEASKYAAVAVFVAINTQLELFEKLGMKKQDRPIPVYIDDPKVRDNAYFDPENYEIHMGIGSGVPMGLTKYISFDLGVSWHENGHHVVMLQTPGKDLPGPEGGALHESTGDVLGQLVMQYWFAVTYGSEIGKTLSVADIKADKRIIGPYAMPPSGIRAQRNSKTVKDKTGEVHDDGEISGAAKADILEAFATTSDAATSSDKLKEAIEAYARTYLLALALVPAHKVTFRDMRRAFITADQQLTNGANRAVIEKCFDARGITAQAATQGTRTRSKTKSRKKK